MGLALKPSGLSGAQHRLQTSFYIHANRNYRSSRPLRSQRCDGVYQVANQCHSTASKPLTARPLSLVGVITYSALNGTPLDVNSVSSIAQLLLTIAGAFLGRSRLLQPYNGKFLMRASMKTPLKIPTAVWTRIKRAWNPVAMGAKIIFGLGPSAPQLNWSGTPCIPLACC